MGFQGHGGFQPPHSEPETTTEIVEVCEYDAQGKLIKKTTTTTTRTTRRNTWGSGPITYGTTTGHAQHLTSTGWTNAQPEYLTDELF